MKKRIFILVCILTGITSMLTKPVLADQVSLITARDVAYKFITYLGETYTIDKIEPLEESDEIVGYLVHLQPYGYILVAGDTVRVPIKAYSLISDFHSLPSAYVKMLLNELKISASAKLQLSKSTAKNRPEEINSEYWEFLTQAKILSRKSLRNYTPDTFLLTTKWAQSYPYNKLNPKIGEQLTLTGCVQTALAQLMRYHAHPSSGSGVFVHKTWWNDQPLTAVMNRPFNWNAMPDSLTGSNTYSVNSSVPEYQQDEVAALMRDLGIFNLATFGTEGTSAVFYYSDFERAFGYAPIAVMNSDNINFFSTIRNEIDNLRPVLLEMPGHMAVTDGYASDETGKKIHVNIGWGGGFNDYYYLDQTNIIGSYTYYPQHTIYYNIKPCQGGECNPYIPTESGKPPVIDSSLNDIVISSEPNYIDINIPKTIRIDTYDPDGDTVTLSATSSCNKLQLNLNGNLLTMTPTATNLLCEVTIKAESYDGTKEKTFKVLMLDKMVYIGTNYYIRGQFADGQEEDEYKAYFDGVTTISGYRYVNIPSNLFDLQGFYISVKDNNGNIVIQDSSTAITYYFPAGLYTIGASLRRGINGSFDKDYSGYKLIVICDSLHTTISDLAESMGIELFDQNEPPSTKPTVETASAISITANSASLNGIVNSNGIATRYFFEYGTTKTYGSVTPDTDAGAGTTDKTVTADLVGLASNTIYNFRLVATNSAGMTYGSNQTFKTNTNILPDNVTSYKVLTEQSGEVTINSGEYVRVFGSSGVNTINVKSGGKAQCVNFVGSNVLKIEDASSGFKVHRSGATVYLENATTGTLIRIPATKTAQQLCFSDGCYNLIISNGKVMLDSQEVTRTASAIMP